MRALIIEKRVQNLTRLTTCSSDTVLYIQTGANCLSTRPQLRFLPFGVKTGRQTDRTVYFKELGSF